MLYEERIATSTLGDLGSTGTTILYNFWNKTDEYWRGFARAGVWL